MRVCFALLVAFAVPAAAQISSRPTDAPLVTAAGESWYQLREPLQLAGELYYPAGATQFFNGNTMVRTGHYNGVPIYADTTLEPFSIVLVPISRGLLQPYERRRSGDLAGTTGSRTPSFPVQMTATATSVPAAPVSPTGLPLPAGAIGVFTPESAVRDLPPRPAAAAPFAPAPGDAVGTSGVQAPRTPAIVSLLRPESNDGVWVRYAGARYVGGGAPVAFDRRAFAYVGEHDAFPVFARPGQPDVIYLPTTRAGMVAPYRIKE
jgi:hypothetical protein